MNIKVAVIPGDGVGSEIMLPALRVLRAVCKKYGHVLNLVEVLACGRALDSVGNPLPEHSLRICQSADAVLMGNVGLNKYKNEPLNKRPERALLTLRKSLELTTNLRPVYLYEEFSEFSSLKKSVIKKGFDVVFVRDIVGGVLCSEKVKDVGEYGPEAYEYEYYNQKIIEDTTRIAFQIALGRNKKLMSFDKANVLESSRLWRKTVDHMAQYFQDICVSHLYIDAAAMELIRRPWDFDVILTPNLFGDIISDEGAGLTGAPELYGSAEISLSGKGLYTPNQLHYADESLIGKQKICPVGMIAAVALMLRYTFQLVQEAGEVERAICRVLAKGYTTEDLKGNGKQVVATAEMGELIANEIEKS